MSIIKCPFCKSKETSRKWTWKRTIEVSDRNVDYSLFESRSSGYRCFSCNRSFIIYSKRATKTTYVNSLQVLSGRV